MADLLQPRRRVRRSLLVKLGTAFFAGLAALAIVDAIRGAPLPAAAAGWPEEATLYRICAALFCAALAGWLFLSGGERRRPEPQDGYLRR